MPDDSSKPIHSEPPGRVVRLEDIAVQAGVSTATVSYALGGTKGVSTTTRLRILKIARDLGYVPNRQAASLRARKTNILGFLVPDIKNPFFSEIVSGLESAVTRRGYRLMLCVTEDDPEDEACHLQMLLEHHVDGLMLIPVSRNPEGEYPNVGLLRAFQHRHIPIMCLVDSINNLPTGRISNGVYQGTRMLMEHLIELGHRDIAYFSQPFQRIRKHGRHMAYHDALREAGIPFRKDLLVEAGLTPTAAYESTGRLLEQGTRFTAAMYPNDYMAIGGLHKLRECGLRVPEDVSVTGLDDVEISRFYEVPLTTAKFPIRQLGETAVCELVDYLGRPDRLESEVFCDIAVQPTLIIRQSTGPARAE